MRDAHVHIATPQNEAAMIDVITLGFCTDPMARWTLPDPRRYLEIMPALIRAFGERAFASGSAYYVDGCAGAALWLPPGVAPDTERLVGLIESNAPAHVVPDAMSVFEEMGRYHLSEPHWYLPLIAVDPAHQGKGFGAALMAYALARCDRDRMPAYLESSNPRNISLYRRHGFEILGTIQVGGSPTVTPMLRKPH